MYAKNTRANSRLNYWTYLFFGAHKWAAKWWWCASCAGSTMIEQIQKKISIARATAWISGENVFFLLLSRNVVNGLGNGIRKCVQNRAKFVSVDECVQKRDWNDRSFSRNIFGLTKNQFIWLIQWHEWRIQNMKIWREKLDRLIYTRLVQREHFFFCENAKKQPELKSVHDAPPLFESAWFEWMRQNCCSCKILIITNAYCEISRFF